MTFILRVHRRNVVEWIGEMTSLLLSGLNYTCFIKANGEPRLYFQGSLADGQTVSPGVDVSSPRKRYFTAAQIDSPAWG